jgi:hypothetical protein
MEMPNTVLELIIVILMPKKLDYLGNELLEVVAERSARVAEFAICGIEDFKREEGLKIGDGLLCGRHEALAYGPYYLVGVQLRMQSSLGLRLIVVVSE